VYRVMERVRHLKGNGGVAYLWVTQSREDWNSGNTELQAKRKGHFGSVVKRLIGKQIEEGENQAVHSFCSVGDSVL